MSKDLNYLENSENFGWGVFSAKLDMERVNLLKKFINGKKILDVGCGSGLYVDYLTKYRFSATGVDFAEEFINFAKKERSGTFVLGKAEKLPFNDGQFDTVLLFDILEHGDDKKILMEAKRVSKKRILIIVPKIVDQKLAQSGVIFRHYIDKTHLREYEVEDLKELAKTANLKLIHIQPVHPLYNETVFMSLFSGSIFLKKVIRKIVFLLLPKRKYPTEYFVVFEK